MRPHQNLDAWSKAVDLVIDVYKQTERFPKEERYGLSSQLRRAAVSIRKYRRRRGSILEKGVRTLPFKLSGFGERSRN